MSRTVVIHQPDFAPHLGFFHRFLEADLYVALDSVQFVRGTSNSWTHRDKIKTPAGVRWLSISVGKTKLGTPINQVPLSTSVDWRTANLNLIEASYRKAPFFGEIFPAVEALYRAPATRLDEFNMRFLDWLMQAFDLDLPCVRSSTLDPQGQRNDLVVDILRKVGATAYLSGLGARAYFDPAPFAAAGIEVRWQNFAHPVYPQQHGDFVPGLSSLDVLFNCGVRGARQILRGLA